MASCANRISSTCDSRPLTSTTSPVSANCARVTRGCGAGETTPLIRVTR
ncbi:Uncharacterised protein [Mycobacteroides abscessus subsp. abscessus]|nr:Uncharacterised protein [Mycobacteroides abscessus subsp. abscessus]